jgi:hypothetical protein
MNKEKFTLRGYFNLRHFDVYGNLLDETTIHNTVTDMGKDEVAGLINGTRTGAFTYLAIGTSGTAASAANTGLLVELAGGMARASATCTQITTDVTNDTARLVHTFNATASYTVQEAGIFDTATSGGRILARGTFTGKAMSSGDTLTVTYDIDVD